MSTTANEFVTPSNTSDALYTATETITHSESLTSATVGGTSYPPGRSVRIGHLVHALRMQRNAAIKR